MKTAKSIIRPIVLTISLILLSPFNYGVPWLNVGRLSWSSGGYLDITSAYSATEIETAGGTTIQQQSQSSLSTAYAISFDNQMRGYIYKPWISQFVINTSLDNHLSNFHDFDTTGLLSQGSVVANLSLYPYSNIDSDFTVGFLPSWTLSTGEDTEYDHYSWFQWSEAYTAATHDGLYQSNYRIDPTQSTLILTGKQTIDRHDLNQSLSLNSYQNNELGGEDKTASMHAKHQFVPEYSGIIANTMISAVDSQPASGASAGPLPVVINTSLAYMYDTEYVDTNTVPRYSGSASLVLDRAGILAPQIGVNLNVGWPTWHQLQMSTQLNYSDAGMSESTVLSHQARRNLKSKVVGQIKYDRFLQGAAQNRWTQTDTALSWSLAAGHGIRYPQVYEQLQPITVGFDQNFNLTGNIADGLQAGNLSHTAVASTKRNDITISSSLSDSRSVQFDSGTNFATQSAQLSLAKPVVTAAYVQSNVRFNAQWHQTEQNTGNRSTHSANLEYNYSNSRIAKQRNLSGNYLVSGKVDDNGPSLGANASINYRIGSMQVSGKSSVALLNDKSFSVSLNVRRFF